MEKREKKKSWRPLIARGGSIEELVTDIQAKIAWCSSENLKSAVFLPVEKVEGVWLWPFVVGSEAALEEMQAQIREIEPDCFDDGEAPISCCVLFEYQKDLVREILMETIKNEPNTIRKEKLLRVLDRFDPSAEAEI